MAAVSAGDDFRQLHSLQIPVHSTAQVNTSDRCRPYGLWIFINLITVSVVQAQCECRNPTQASNVNLSMGRSVKAQNRVTGPESCHGDVSASGASTFHDHAFACVAHATCQWSPRGVLLPPETMSKSVAPLAPSSRSYCLPLETKESESCAAAPNCISTRTHSVA